MRLGSIDFPTQLIKAIRSDRLVVFAGTGVSMGEPACLPDFKRLVELIIQKPVTDDTPLDRILGIHHHRGVHVHEKAKELLSNTTSQPTLLHHQILRLFPGPEKVRLITTNYDELFEKATPTLWTSPSKIFEAPALPLGKDFRGIVHVHGAISGPLSGMVLTDGDFGRAYLTEGWARRFFLDVFQNFTVLFIGYSHEDLILQYIARALPANQSEKNIWRFALGEEVSRLKWDLLGINLIPFPTWEGNNFGALNEGIQKLSDLVQKGTLEWQTDISQMSDIPPSIDQEQIDFILDIFEEGWKTNLFTKVVREVSWIEWLDEHQILEPLFNPNPLSESGKHLSSWIIVNFLQTHSDNIFALLGNHSLQLNPEFGILIANHVVSPDSSLSPSDFNRWISYLLKTFPKSFGQSLLMSMIQKCSDQSAFESLLQTFERILENSLHIDQHLVSKGGASKSVTYIFEFDHGNLLLVWKNWIQPHINVIAPQILCVIVSNLAERFRTRCQLGLARREGDSDSFARPAIEPHEQNWNFSPVDVVVDCGREALDWLQKNDEILFKSWVARLLREDAPLLRRLAVYGLRE